MQTKPAESSEEDSSEEEDNATQLTTQSAAPAGATASPPAAVPKMKPKEESSEEESSEEESTTKAVPKVAPKAAPKAASKGDSDDDECEDHEAPGGQAKPSNAQPSSGQQMAAAASSGSRSSSNMPAQAQLPPGQAKGQTDSGDDSEAKVGSKLASGSVQQARAADEVKAQEMSRVASNVKKEEKIEGRVSIREQKMESQSESKHDTKEKKLDERRDEDWRADEKFPGRDEKMETKETVPGNWPKPSPWAYSMPILRNPVGRQRRPGTKPRVLPEEEEEALLEAFGCFTGGRSRLKASGAASFMKSVFNMSGIDERAMQEVIQEQATAGTDSLAKHNFSELVGTFFEDRDPVGELVELWKDMGGATAGDGFIKSSEVHRVLEASGLFVNAPPEMLKDFCCDKEFLNYDDFVRMIAEPRVPRVPLGWEAGRAVLSSANS
jgi:hypothetical protein